MIPCIVPIGVGRGIVEWTLLGKSMEVRNFSETAKTWRLKVGGWNSWNGQLSPPPLPGIRNARCFCRVIVALQQGLRIVHFVKISYDCHWRNQRHINFIVCNLVWTNLIHIVLQQQYLWCDMAFVTAKGVIRIQGFKGFKGFYSRKYNQLRTSRICGLLRLTSIHMTYYVR